MKYFASFRFDEHTGMLFRDRQPVRLTRKAGGLLRCLIEQAGALVTHKAIMATVWPDTYVQPDNVKVLIRELRVALGDDSRQPRFIQSQPTRGYVFIALVADMPPRVELAQQVIRSP
jgi:DNA-binding winged helix-turn-helix (wHTH) protein